MRIVAYLLLLTCGCYVLHRLWKKLKRENSQNMITPKDDGSPKIPEANKKQKEDLAHCLDMVNSWIGNCDQKAGIVLSAIGVALTILMTSDFVVQLRKVIFKPFFDYWEGLPNLGFNCTRFMVFIFLLLTLCLLTKATYMMVKTITPNIDYDKMYKENTSLVPHSYIYFKSISSMSYDAFNAGNVNYLDDLKSQIYVNSKIASAKFENFIEGLYWLKMTLFFAMLLFLSIMFL